MKIYKTVKAARKAAKENSKDWAGTQHAVLTDSGDTVYFMDGNFVKKECGWISERGNSAIEIYMSEKTNKKYIG
jgi:hypothetical protein